MVEACSGQARDVHQFSCASQVLLFVEHVPHCDVARVLLPQITRKEHPADDHCSLGFLDHLHESGQPDVPVWRVFLENIPPEGYECLIGEVVGLADGLHLVP